MKITKEKKQIVIDGEKENFIYVQHPRYTEKAFVEIIANNITVKDWRFLIGSKNGGNIDRDTVFELRRFMFTRRIVILYRFIKWLYKK